MRLTGDERAQSVGLARFFMSVFVVGTLLWFILDRLGTPLLQGAKNATSNGTANSASNMFIDFIGLVPVIMIIVGFMGIVLLAIYQREVLR